MKSSVCLLCVNYIVCVCGVRSVTEHHVFEETSIAEQWTVHQSTYAHRCPSPALDVKYRLLTHIRYDARIQWYARCHKFPTRMILILKILFNRKFVYKLTFFWIRGVPFQCRIQPLGWSYQVLYNSNGFRSLTLLCRPFCGR